MVASNAEYASVPGRLVRLSRSEFEKLSAYICRQTGILFRANKQYLLENRLSNRLNELGCKSYSEYLRYLQHDPTGREFLRFTGLITIGETSFMRNLPQLLIFQKKVLPNLMRRVIDGEVQRLRFWSAGCASGEEPYSLAMLALEKYPAFCFSRKLEVIGSDIDATALEHARRGQYRLAALRKLPRHYVENYFRLSDGSAEVSQKVKALVKFTHLNLVDAPRMDLMRNIDLIFFRNVMIYFDEEARQKTIAHMYDSLRPGGCLFLGHSESLHGISKAFTLVNLGSHLAYQKG